MTGVATVVVTGNETAVLPPGTVTDAGTTARDELEKTRTGNPLPAAGPVSDTVAVVALPCKSVEGASTSCPMTGGLTVMAPDTDDAPRVAVMSTGCSRTTPMVATGTISDAAPGGKCAVAGTEAAVCSFRSRTDPSPLPAIAGDADR